MPELSRATCTRRRDETSVWRVQLTRAADPTLGTRCRPPLARTSRPLTCTSATVVVATVRLGNGSRAMLRIWTLTGVATAAAFTVPAAAHGAAIVAPACVNGGTSPTITGSGFGPNSVTTVKIGAGAEVRAPTDAQGSFSIRAPTVAVTAGGARDDSVSARGAELTSAGQPVFQASALMRVQRPEPGLKPGSRRPSLAARFAGAGYPTGRTVYAHLRFRGRTIKTRKIGVAEGPCGVVRGRVRGMFRVPGRRGPYPNDDRRYSIRVAAASRLTAGTRPTGVIPLHYRHSLVDGRREVTVGTTSWLEGGS